MSLQRDVRSIAKRLGVNLVIVTHDIDEAVLMGDRALIMAGSPGRIFHDLTIDLGDPRERQDPAVQAERARLMKCFEGAAGGQPDRSAGEAEADHDESSKFEAMNAADSLGTARA